MTSLVVAAGVPVVGALSQGVTVIPTALWWAVAALVPIHLAMMLCFELPDLESDRRAGKRVLAVRIGRDWTSRLLVGLGITTGLIVTAGYLADALSRRSLLSLLAIVPAVAALASLRTRRYGVLTASAVATLTVAALGLLLGSI
jgi:1,4-dihydroxy-2-naphthoate octaprenyltransferase